MTFIRSLLTVSILAGTLLAPVMATAAETKFDFACKPLREEVTGTNSTGGAIKPFDLNDPYYTMTYSVDSETFEYCVLTRCDGGMVALFGPFGDEYATTYQNASDTADEDGDIFAVYEAINPKTNTMRLRIIYYDNTGLYMTGASTLYDSCTPAKFSNGGNP